MPPPLTIRSDYTSEDLETMADAADDKAYAQRLRAIAAVLKGASRQAAAEIGGMQRQTLRDWVQRFNAWGPDGLLSRKPPGRPAKLSSGQKHELARLLLSAAANETYGVRRWRLSDVTAVAKRRYGVKLDEVSVGRMLRSLGVLYDGRDWRATRCGELPSIAPAAMLADRSRQAPAARMSPEHRRETEARCLRHTCP